MSAFGSCHATSFSHSDFYQSNQKLLLRSRIQPGILLYRLHAEHARQERGRARIARQRKVFASCTVGFKKAPRPGVPILEQNEVGIEAKRQTPKDFLATARKRLVAAVTEGPQENEDSFL